MRYRAVIFDLGGVVFPSPLDAFRAYEREHALPERFLSKVVLADPERGAWSRLERGELTFGEFQTTFEAECAGFGSAVDTVELMDKIGAGFEPRVPMVHAITRIRAEGLKTGALTNNWAADARTAGDGVVGVGASVPTLRGLFDVVVESAVEGLRKPDPDIYLLTCERLVVEPAEAVFLDDLGANLKPARELGMTTIKVADPDVALAELASALGFPVHT